MSESKTEKFDRLVAARNNSAPDKGAVLDNLMGTASEHEPEQKTETDVQTTQEQETTSETQPTSKTKTEPIQETEQIKEHEEIQEQQPEQIHEPDVEWLQEYSRGSKVEDTHTRATWLIENDLLKRLDKLAKGKKKGFKTDVVNRALKSMVETLEGIDKRKG